MAKSYELAGILQIIQKNTHLIREYLSSVAEIIPLLDLFAEDPDKRPEGRLFYKLSTKGSKGAKVDSVVCPALDVIFQNPVILACYEAKRHEWVPVMTVENIQRTRKEMRDFFFQPIREAININTKDEWAFLKKQIGEDEFELFLDNLACAFIYKIGLSIERPTEKVVDDKDDLVILAEMLNTTTSPELLVDAYEKKQIAKLSVDIKSLFAKMTNKEIKAKEFSASITALREDVRLKALPESDDLLCNELFTQFSQLEDKKGKFKPVIATALFGLLREGLIAGNRTLILLGLIADSLGEKDQGECMRRLNPSEAPSAKPPEKYGLPKLPTKLILFTAETVTDNPASPPSSPLPTRVERKGRLRRITSRAQLDGIFAQPSTAPTESRTTIPSSETPEKKR